jgi:5'-AMP-activated protein kinase, regulatory gamma subunit
VTPDASIEVVFDVLHGISALPIVNEHGVLMDLYARGDVIRLAANSAYRSIPLKNLSVAQALGAARPTTLTEQNDPSSTHYGRFSTCVRGDTLRTALEMLSLPNIRRLIVVDPTTKHVEGVVSLSDVFSFLIDHS